MIENSDLRNENNAPMIDMVSRSIYSCLDPLPGDDGRRIVYAAYLMYKIKEHRLMDFETGMLSELSPESLDMPEDIFYAIRESISSDEWSRLKPFLGGADAQEFAITAMHYRVPQYSKGTLETTPDSVVELAEAILQIDTHDRVADIGCGVGSFLNHVASKRHDAVFCGIDKYQAGLIIARIRADLLDSKVEYLCRDVFTVKDMRFDKIFANYPFGFRVRQLVHDPAEVNDVFGNYPGLNLSSSSDWLFNAQICNMLSSEGRAVAIMTNGSTWNTSDAKIRQSFIDRGLIEAVILLPGRLFGYTGIPTTMIVLSHGNKEVRLVNAYEICHQGRRNNEFLADDIDRIVAALHEDSPYSILVNKKQMAENEFTLNFHSYATSEIPAKDAKPFKSIVKKIFRGASIRAEELDDMTSDEITPYRYLRLSDIQDSLISAEIPYLKEIPPRMERNCVKNGALLLSKNGKPFKVAIAEVDENEKVLASANIFIIELDEELVDPYYLLAFFDSDEGRVFLNSVSVGTTLPGINLSLLQKAQIPIPSKNVQTRIAEAYKTKLDEVAVLKRRLSKALDNLHHAYSSIEEVE